MMTKHFCTLFDIKYALKGILMVTSLLRNCPNATIYVLCMDQKTRDLLTRIGIDAITLIDLCDVETVELLRVKKLRTKAEYCWTLTPVFTHYIFGRFPSLTQLTYLDADLFFFSSPKTIFDEIGNSSIGIIEHRFPPMFKNLNRFGRFCVEWVTFRRSKEGMECLEDWKAKCIDWCYSYFDRDRMGDQKYLDVWPKKYNELVVISSPGAGWAPWNYSNNLITKGIDDSIYCGHSRLIYFHFHQFSILGNGNYDRLSDFYRQQGPEPELIYSAYERKIGELIKLIESIGLGSVLIYSKKSRMRSLRTLQAFLPLNVKNIIKTWTARMRCIIRG